MRGDLHLCNAGISQIQDTLLIGAVGTQCDDAFLLTHCDYLNIDCDYVVNAHRGEKSQHLPKVDASWSRKLIAQHSRDHRSDQQAMCYTSTKGSPHSIL